MKVCKECGNRKLSRGDDTRVIHACFTIFLGLLFLIVSIVRFILGSPVIGLLFLLGTFIIISCVFRMFAYEKDFKKLWIVDAGGRK